MDNKYTIKRYIDGVECTFPDKRRVVTIDDAPDSLYVEFNIIDDNVETINVPAALHKVVDDNIKVTALRISKSAAEALVQSLYILLKNNSK